MLILTILLTFAPATNAYTEPDPPAVFCASLLRTASVWDHDFDDERVDLRLDGEEVERFVSELALRRAQIKGAVGDPAHYRGTLPHLALTTTTTGGLVGSLPFLSNGGFAAASVTLIALALTEFPTYPLRWLTSRDRSYGDLLKTYEEFKRGPATEFGWRRRYAISREFNDRLRDGTAAPDVRDEIERQLGTPFRIRRGRPEARELRVSIYADKSPRMRIEIEAGRPAH